MGKIVAQIIKFGAVGALCFVIDWLTGLLVLNLARPYMAIALATQLAAVTGFTVSVIINYILSFMFVFERKEDMNRKAEFVIFMVLSIIGLGINSLIIGICTGPIYNGIPFLQRFHYNLIYTAGKVIATGVVMVYNFITRKIFLEKKNNNAA